MGAADREGSRRRRFAGAARRRLPGIAALASPRDRSRQVRYKCDTRALEFQKWQGRACFATKPGTPICQAHAASKHRSSSVGAVDQTAGSGAERSRLRRGCFRRQAAVRATHHAAAQQPAGRSRTSPPLPMQIDHRARRCASLALGELRVARSSQRRSADGGSPDPECRSQRSHRGQFWDARKWAIASALARAGTIPLGVAVAHDRRGLHSCGGTRSSTAAAIRLCFGRAFRPT